MQFSIGLDTVAIPDVTVFPNPVLRGKLVQVVARDLQNKLDVIVTDAQGIQIWRNTSWGLTGESTMYIPTDVFSAGEYMVEVRRDGLVEVRKIVVQAP